MPVILIVSLIVVVVVSGALVVFARTRKQSLERPWREFAEANDMKFEPKYGIRPGRISGKYRGRHVDVNAHPVKRDDGVWVTHMHITVNFKKKSGGNSLTIRQLRAPARVHHNALKMLLRKVPSETVRILAGAAEAPVARGEDVMDRRFLIMSQPEDYAMRLFSTNINLHHNLPRLRPSEMVMELNGQLHFDQVGLEQEPEDLQFLLDYLCDLIEAAEEQRRTKLDSNPRLQRVELAS